MTDQEQDPRLDDRDDVEPGAPGDREPTSEDVVNPEYERDDVGGA